MERRFRSCNVFKTDHEENGTIRTPKPENLVESLPSMGAFAETMKSASTSSPKGSKRSLKKKVISIPIKESKGSPHKAGEGAPPSDSWAWRKYGQKPIKGSPYPRGYYRCSSSKGCPARKQVERSRDDPTMLVITYSCEHNHPWPTPRNSRHHQNHRNVNAAAGTTDNPPDKPESTDVSTLDVEGEQDQEPEPETESAEKFASRRKDGLPLMAGEDEFFGWFTDMEMATSSVFESPVFNGKIFRDDDPSVALLFPTREEKEEDESLFADLGELPECSVVFRHLDEGAQVQIC